MSDRTRKIIPYGKQWINKGDVDAVIRVLRSERITQGPMVEKFEKVLADYCGAAYAVAVNSGTSALHIACLAAGVGPGDEVITSPITFVASANCAIYCGAIPVFADIDALTYTISPDTIRKKMTARTKAVIPVHMAGQSCDMETINKIAKSEAPGRRVYIIEDACHALGSQYKGKRVGGCTWSDMAVMSFHPVKHITTGEGGAILTNDAAIYEKLRILRSHGITTDPKQFRNLDMACLAVEEDGKVNLNPWYYEQSTLGYNYRITDLQCALGNSQMARIDAVRKRRREIVDHYNTAFSGFESLRIPYEAEHCESNFHLYILLFDFEALGKPRAEVMTSLRERGIQTQVHYIPVYLQPYYRDRFRTRQGECAQAEDYYSKCLSLPLFPTLARKDVAYVIREIKKLVAH